MRELRESILEEEWESHGKSSAKRAAVSQFEAYCVEHGHIASGAQGDQQGKPRITYHSLTQLYNDPDNMDVVEDDTLRAKLRSMVQQSMDTRLREAYKDATARAEDMARLLKEGPGSIAEIIQRLLPIPKFLKGK